MLSNLHCSRSDSNRTCQIIKHHQQADTDFAKEQGFLVADVSEAYADEAGPLFAAAPEMLAALQAVLPAFTEGNRHLWKHISPAHGMHIHSRVIEAIAKATS